MLGPYTIVSKPQMRVMICGDPRNFLSLRIATCKGDSQNLKLQFAGVHTNISRLWFAVCEGSYQNKQLQVTIFNVNYKAQ